MQPQPDISSKLHLVRANPNSGNATPAGCEGQLSVLNQKIQALLDHVTELEDRVGEVEDSLVVGGPGNGSEQIITAGAVTVDHSARRVFVNSREVTLTPTEYRLIRQLAINSGRVVLHRDLLRRASVYGDVNRGNLKVYIARLRAKLSEASEEEFELRVVRGVGYRLSA